ncbi:MAG TPA: peptide chain release factor N(5)-glutamine methyltransferase [Candidatus Saccharimonadales bacterium]|jgi:release factor glutamine methyltransferase|nr:peptide chain release factor N(5)-glutamine methyltransferase [Candidatus Saccharimonadales bacterium]
MNLKQAIDSAYGLFQREDVPSPRLNAELLMMFVLGCDRAYLFAHPERQLNGEEQIRYEEVIDERARGCPTQYITGHQEFWGLDLIVSPAVLIPRPETEHVVETVLDLVRSLDPEQPLNLVDVGTGSGCIALALATELPTAQMDACDLSEDALEIARANAARLGAESRVLFQRSDLLAAYVGRQFDFVVSNPPYVGESEADKVQKQVKEFEPKMAVFSGWEGMDIYRRLVPQAYEVLKPGGWLVMEIGFSTEEKVKSLLSGWTSIQTTADLQGIPRVVAARRGKPTHTLVTGS